MIIGIAGKKGVGKDTVADYIKSVYPSFIKYSFADPLKHILYYLTDWTPAHLYGDLKEVVDPEWGFSPREAMQKIGTEGFRKLLRNDFWVKVAEKRIRSNLNYIIPDIRFENEAEFVINNNGIVINVKRNIINEDYHASEKGIEWQSADFIVYNYGTKEELYKQINNILDEVL